MAAGGFPPGGHVSVPSGRGVVVHAEPSSVQPWKSDRGKGGGKVRGGGSDRGGRGLRVRGGGVKSAGDGGK